MENNIKQTGWVGIDLDGTLAEYHGMPKDRSIGKPIGPCVQAVKNLLSRGIEVRIVTARACSDHVNVDGVPAQDRDEICKVERWCEEHIGQKLPVVFWKDRRMVELWCDRSIQMIPNEGIPIVIKSIPVVRIAEKIYLWAKAHNWTAPVIAWEELRNVLGLPAPEPEKLIIPATSFPLHPKGPRRA